MADLLDIAPATAVESVHIGEHKVTVRGISVGTMAVIISRFPDLKSLASGNPDDVVMRLVTGCGAAVGPIIAAGCGHFGDREWEQRAGDLLPEIVIELMGAILRLTFPNGIGSFVAKLSVLIGGAGEGTTKAIKVRLKKSPSPSPPSSDAVFSQTMQ